MPWLDEQIRDALLLEGIARGDADAADMFFAAHGETLYGALLTLFPNPYDSAEALRRVVLTVIERAPAFAGERRVEAGNWLLGVVAEVSGVGVERLAGLQDTAVEDLHELADDTPLGVTAASETAQHLRPLGGGRGDGMIVARGTSAQVKSPPQGNLLEMARRAIVQLNRDFDGWREDEARSSPARFDDVATALGEVADPTLTPTVARGPDAPLRTGDQDVERLPMPGPTPGTERIRAPGRTPSTETLRIVHRPGGRSR